MNKYFAVFIVAVLIVMTGCEQPLEYKYQDRAQPIDCPGLDKALLHEALYSFKEDLGNFYKDPDVIAGTDRFYMQGLATYVYDGMSGYANFQQIASPHTLKVFEQLKLESQIWDANNSVSRLNYNSELISCLFDNIIDEELRALFLRLNEVDALDPSQVASQLTRKIYKAYTDQHLTMYIALDGFYQHLYKLD